MAPHERTPHITTASVILVTVSLLTNKMLATGHKQVNIIIPIDNMGYLKDVSCILFYL